MSGELTAEEELAVRLEERAGRLRTAMLRDREFIAGLDRGLEDEREGRMISFAEFKRALDLA
ncbi:MAG TPA: hypothetical protein VEQ11_11570 [Chloroflexota bacterium]|nr:hypothetical protein [Chloroflexota bacterium]